MANVSFMTDEQFVHTINVEDAENTLMHLDSQALERLYGFGQILFGEVQQRSSQLDSKLTSILGWSSAMLAFLVLDLGTHTRGAINVSLIGLAASFAFGGLIAAALGIRSTRWIIPSEADWFRDGILDRPDDLTRYYVLSLLETHQDQNRENSKKSRFLAIAERCLIGGGLALGVVMLWRVIAAIVLT
jgi:hypothetical protein